MGKFGSVFAFRYGESVRGGKTKMHLVGDAYMGSGLAEDATRS